MGIHAVTLGGEGRYFPQVRSDDHAGMKMLMTHLFDLGHRRIGIFNVDADNYSARRRFDAYLQQMSARDLNLHPSWICTISKNLQENEQEQERVYKQLFNSSQPPTAVICCGITLTMSMLQVLHRHHVKVPKAVSICGYDDFKEFSLVSPPVTTIRQPLVEMGKVVVRSLLSVISGQGVEDAILPVELVVRKSTGPAPE
jgi:DNA-binding LacI/PurR family transcriptional regulator